MGNLRLGWWDIREAFERQIGSVIWCAVDRGVASVIFERTDDAMKAVRVFDCGRLNGRTIYVRADF